MKLLNFCSKVIEYSFYLIFFLVPLAFTSDTSELFEFNKLWITFILTIVISFAWFTKMVIKKEFRIQRTPLDIPIGLFLVSQIISTVLSLDTHISLWGYYSRFNGGLLSIFAYVFLFYAFVSNFKKENEEEKEPLNIKRISFFAGGLLIFILGTLISSKITNPDPAGIPFQMLATLITVILTFAAFMKAAPKGIIKRSIYAIFASAVLVILWGLPSHFGYDPTCLLFRGTFDVSCWTADFQPMVRMFSTLGQPAWLAAYLVVLLPILAAYIINFSKGKTFFDRKISLIKNHNFFVIVLSLILFSLFYVSLLYTNSRSAIMAFWMVLPILAASYFWFYLKPSLKDRKFTLDFKTLMSLLLLIAGVTFFAGQPFGQLNKFTWSGIQSSLQKPQTAKPAAPAPTPAPVVTTELGGTDSGKIRLLVWKGAIDIWKNYPVFGSGVETYAFAYYKFRPEAHNLVSEWKYLYNKAHNEFLNYLATTGTVGIVTYLSMIGMFLFITLKHIYKKRSKLLQNEFLVLSLLTGYIAILITNFFGFSVVIINIFFYIIPALALMLLGLINYDKAYVRSFSKNETYILTLRQKGLISILALISIYSIYTLINFWNADRNYYFGYNYDRAGDYQRAYTFLQNAIKQRPDEPVFKDEYAFNNAVLGAAILAQQSQKEQDKNVAKQLVDTAINTTNKLTTEHPNNLVFWKTKVRVYYTLGQVDPAYLSQALIAIKKSAELAPTDADVLFNLGVLYGQTGDGQNAIKTLEKTVKLKPDYFNAQYALGIFYHQLGVDASGKIINQEYNQKSIEQMESMIKTFGPNQTVQDALDAWNGGKP